VNTKESVFVFLYRSFHQITAMNRIKLQSQTCNKCQQKLTSDHCLLPLPDTETLIAYQSLLCYCYCVLLHIVMHTSTHQT